MREAFHCVILGVRKLSLLSLSRSRFLLEVTNISRGHEYSRGLLSLVCILLHSEFLIISRPNPQGVRAATLGCTSSPCFFARLELASSLWC